VTKVDEENTLEQRSVEIPKAIGCGCGSAIAGEEKKKKRQTRRKGIKGWWRFTKKLNFHLSSRATTGGRGIRSRVVRGEKSVKYEAMQRIPSSIMPVDT